MTGQISPQLATGKCYIYVVSTDFFGVKSQRFLALVNEEMSGRGKTLILLYLNLIITMRW